MEEWLNFVSWNNYLKQILVWFECPVDEEPGELVISKKNSEGPGPMGLDLDHHFDFKMSNNKHLLPQQPFLISINYHKIPLRIFLGDIKNIH